MIITFAIVKETTQKWDQQEFVTNVWYHLKIRIRIYRELKEWTTNIKWEILNELCYVEEGFDTKDFL